MIVPAVLVAVVQDLECILHRRAHRDETLAPPRAGLGDSEHLLLGGLQYFLTRPAFRLKGIADDFRPGVNELANTDRSRTMSA